MVSNRTDSYQCLDGLMKMADSVERNRSEHKYMSYGAKLDTDSDDEVAGNYQYSIIYL